MLRINPAPRAVRDRRNQSIAMTVSRLRRSRRWPAPSKTGIVGTMGSRTRVRSGRESPTANWRAAPN